MSALARRRLRAATAVACVVAATVSVTGTGGAAGGQCRSIDAASGGWTAAPLPATASLPAFGESPIVATSAVGQNASVTVATDGVSVFRTADGGCTWQTVFNLAGADYYSDSGLIAGYSITNIANGHDSGPTEKQDVYLALSPNPMNVFSMVTLFGAALPELFAASHDGGRTFSVIAPQPSAAGPYPVECALPPNIFFVPPGAGKTVYVQCPGAFAQAVAEQAVSGGQTPVFRSNDGGVSWSMFGAPAVSSTPGVRWLVPGVQKNELWTAGVWNLPGTSQNFLAAWRSHDGGATWARSILDPKPMTSGASLSTTGLAVDYAPGAGRGTAVVYSGIGTYSSNDSGKRWHRLRAFAFTNGSRPPASGFFLGHSLYIWYAGQLTCKATPVLVRYRRLSSRPAAVPLPSKWGGYSAWTPDSTSAAASGLARFCDRTGAVTIAKLLNLRIH